MQTVKLDTEKSYGKFKIMHAVNNGPIHKRHAKDQARSNLEDYRALKIPYARNHDASFCASYGGAHTVDISAIFPNFDADVDDPASYDFACTDEYVAITALAGTETFFRLGQAIEHYIKKYYIHPPKDNIKWARICEHIIRHYNYGWADGFHYGIKYWEIWNEPDLDVNEPVNKRCWSGTQREFFDLFATAAKHLKSCFPELKIGGPAIAGNVTWGDEFLADMRAQSVPMDFFSWHIYAKEIKPVVERAHRIKEILEKNGYGEVESILNEWNYVRGWTGEVFTYSLKSINGIKGAIFALSVMLECQRAPVDMLMYYDARPCRFNGIFNEYYEKLKTYYSFAWYRDMYGLDHEIGASSSDPDLHVSAGVDKDGKVSAIVAYYAELDDQASDKTVKIDAPDGEYEVYLLDAEHDGTLVGTSTSLEFTLKPLSAIMIKQK